MRNKKLITAMLIGAMVSAFSFTAFAGVWQSDANGWWWQNNDGTYPVNSWQWLDGNNDGIAECYYFNESGYMLANTTTPDGYWVNENGAWTELGIVRTQPAETPAPIEAAESEIIPSGYNEDGISNIVIDMLEHTRAENAKYGESSVMDFGGNTYILYSNYGFAATYHGLDNTESEKPLRVQTYGDNASTSLFDAAPMTGSVEQDYNQLKNSGFDITTDGITSEILCGKYGIHLDSDSARCFIRFDYR